MKHADEDDLLKKARWACVEANVSIASADDVLAIVRELATRLALAEKKVERYWRRGLALSAHNRELSAALGVDPSADAITERDAP